MSTLACISGLKSGFEQVKRECLSEDHPSLTLVNWHYKIKEFYQLTDALLDDFQYLHQLKWLAHITQRE